MSPIIPKGDESVPEEEPLFAPFLEDMRNRKLGLLLGPRVPATAPPRCSPEAIPEWLSSWTPPQRLVESKQGQLKKARQELEVATDQETECIQALQLASLSHELKKAEAQKEASLRMMPPEPSALELAVMEVKKLTKAEIKEIASLQAPPRNVQRTMEMVWLLLSPGSSTKPPPWPSARRRVLSELIPQIMQGGAAVHIDSTRQSYLRKTFLTGNNSLSQESVRRANKACAALFRWACAVLNASTKVEDAPQPQVVPLASPSPSHCDALLAALSRAKERVHDARQLVDRCAGELNDLRQKKQERRVSEMNTLVWLSDSLR